MLIIPAIDLKEGKVVRLFQGKGEATVYSRNPAVVARHWQKQGAKLIHVVDLDGAFSGSPKNLESVKKIIRAVQVPIEFGGGIRDKETARKIFALGAERIVLGTRAIEDRDFLRRMRQEYQDKVIVSLDAKNGLLVTEGWQNLKSDLGALEFALQLEDLGFSQIIYTDTSQDGTLKGPNLRGIAELLKATGLKIIASGGISSLEDLRQLKDLNRKRISGVIVGKALYENRFSLKEANILLTGKK